MTVRNHLSEIRESKFSEDIHKKVLERVEKRTKSLGVDVNNFKSKTKGSNEFTYSVEPFAIKQLNKKSHANMVLYYNVVQNNVFVEVSMQIISNFTKRSDAYIKIDEFVFKV